MKTRIYFNTTDAPVVVDGEGRTLGGGEWLAAERNDEIRRAIDHGQLVESEPDESVIDNGTEAAKAHKAAIEDNQAAEAEKADTAAVQDTAGDEQVESPKEKKKSTSRNKPGEKQER